MHTASSPPGGLCSVSTMSAPLCMFEYFEGIFDFCFVSVLFFVSHTRNTEL